MEKRFGPEVAAEYASRIRLPIIMYSVALVIGLGYVAVVLASLIIRDTDSTRLSRVITNKAKTLGLLRIVGVWAWGATFFIAVVVDRLKHMPNRTSATRNMGKMSLLAVFVLGLAVWETVLWATRSDESSGQQDTTPFQAFLLIGVAVLTLGLFFMIGAGAGGRETPVQYFNDVGSSLRTRKIFSDDVLREADSGIDPEAPPPETFTSSFSSLGSSASQPSMAEEGEAVVTAESPSESGARPSTEMAQVGGSPGGERDVPPTPAEAT